MNSEILKSLREEGSKVERRVKRRVGYDTSDDVDEARDQMKRMRIQDESMESESTHVEIAEIE